MHPWIAKVRAASGRQAGRIAWWQVLAAGATVDQARSAIRRGLLIRVLPRVYAFGAVVAHPLGALWEAILYAGPGAMLSHASAAYHRALIAYPPPQVHVSTPKRTRSQPGIVVHPLRNLEREVIHGVPVTTIAQTAVDLAAQYPDNDRLLRRFLSQLDYRGDYDPHRLRSACGKGTPGSKPLQHAMIHHDPSVARLNSPLEEDLYALLNAWSFDPLPEINVEPVPGITVDAYFRRHRTALETDGYANHHTPAQLHRDRQRDLTLRANDVAVVRYDWALIHSRPVEVYDDLMKTLTEQGLLLNVAPPTGVRPA